MVGYQLVLTVAGYLLYVHAEREKRAADALNCGMRIADCGIRDPGDEGRRTEDERATPNAATSAFGAGNRATLNAGFAWPTVSILIPAHNEEKVIERTVRAM